MKDCIIYQGPRPYGNYGGIKVNGKYTRVHRIVWEDLVGKIPDSCVVHHTCRDGMCINPEHLQVMTRAEHSIIHQKDRVKTHCIHGHEFTKESTSIQQNHQVCKICARERSKNHRVKEKLCNLLTLGS